MGAKRKPSGFVAICQCGVTVGAMDYERTDRSEAGQMIGKWLHEGCTVQPMFGGSWSVNVGRCECDAPSDPTRSTQSPAGEPTHG